MENVSDLRGLLYFAVVCTYIVCNYWPNCTLKFIGCVINRTVHVRRLCYVIGCLDVNMRERVSRCGHVRGSGAIA